MHLVRLVAADVRVDLSATTEHHLPVNRVASDLGQDLVYSIFWHQAWARANKSLELRLNQSHDELTPYPRVFVYNLSTPISDWDPAAATRDEVYGKRIAFNGHLRDTNHYGFSMVLTYRIWHSMYYRTNNPMDADLFLVPIMVKPKRGKAIENACLSNVTEEAVLAQLPFLNFNTAHKHLLVVAKEHYEALKCDWFSSPKGLLRRAIRLAYSQVQPRDYLLDCVGQCNYCDCNVSSQDPLQKERSLFARELYTYPNTFSVPYVSTIHWPALSKPTNRSRRGSMHSGVSEPWDVASRRAKYLFLFLGSAHHGDVAVRKQIGRTCRRCSIANSSVCACTKYDLKRTLILKHRSTFCLEPPGDSPYRRSFTDSLVLGCIPVLFSRLQDDYTYPWLWSRWREEARVIIPRQEFLTGEIDLVRLLASAPPGLVAHMQRTISQHARLFQFSEDDDEHDQLHALLTGALRESKRLSASHES